MLLTASSTCRTRGLDLEATRSTSDADAAADDVAGDDNDDDDDDDDDDDEVEEEMEEESDDATGADLAAEDFAAVAFADEDVRGGGGAVALCA